MRCYFLLLDHIQGVQELFACASEEDAIKQAHLLFQEQTKGYDGFESWDSNQMVYRHRALMADGGRNPT